MASSRFLLKCIHVSTHFLAECPVCGAIASVLVPSRANMLERRLPKCLRCRAEMDPNLGTIDVQIRLEECG